MGADMTAVMIVGIVFSFVAFSVYMKHQTDRLKYGVETGNSELLKENEQLHNQVDELEKRVQILESIVTGKEFGLKNEIDALA